MSCVHVVQVEWSILCRVCRGVSGGWTQGEEQFVGVGCARTRSRGHGLGRLIVDALGRTRTDINFFCFLYPHRHQIYFFSPAPTSNFFFHPH